MTLREYLALLEGLEAGLVDFDPEGFYYLARTTLVKDERFIDRFDRVFSEIFGGILGEGPLKPSISRRFPKTGCAGWRKSICRTRRRR